VAFILFFNTLYKVNSNKYLSFDSVSKQEVYDKSAIQPTDDRPLLSLADSNMVMNHLINFIFYPVYAIENKISGKVVISVKVDSDGKITDYQTYKSVDKSIDDEAIKVIKLMPFEFLPEYKNGNSVASEFKIPIFITLQN
jgi:TonB family protein